MDSPLCMFTAPSIPNITVNSNSHKIYYVAHILVILIHEWFWICIIGSNIWQFFWIGWHCLLVESNQLKVCYQQGGVRYCFVLISLSLYFQEKQGICSVYVRQRRRNTTLPHKYNAFGCLKSTKSSCVCFLFKFSCNKWFHELILLDHEVACHRFLVFYSQLIITLFEGELEKHTSHFPTAATATISFWRFF